MGWPSTQAASTVVRARSGRVRLDSPEHRAACGNAWGDRARDGRLAIGTATGSNWRLQQAGATRWSCRDGTSKRGSPTNTWRLQRSVQIKRCKRGCSDRQSLKGSIPALRTGGAIRHAGAGGRWWERNPSPGVRIRLRCATIRSAFRRRAGRGIPADGRSRGSNVVRRGSSLQCHGLHDAAG